MSMFGNNGAVSRMMGVDPRFVREGPYSMAQQPNLGAPSPFTPAPLQTMQMPSLMPEAMPKPDAQQDRGALGLFGPRTRQTLGDVGAFLLANSGSPEMMQHNERRRQELAQSKQQQQRLEFEQSQPVFREVNGSIVRIDPRTGQSQVAHQGQTEPQQPTNLEREYDFIRRTQGEEAATMFVRNRSEGTPLTVSNGDGTYTIVPRSQIMGGGQAPAMGAQSGRPAVGSVVADPRRGGAPQGNRPFDPSRLDAVTAGAESGNRDYANGRPVTSPKGAQFAMQVMPETARDPGFGLRPANPSNAADMNRLGREYRAAMQQRYGGDLARMWAAYNAGPGRVDEAIRLYGNNWLAHMPAETQGYVARTMRRAGAR